MISLSRGNEIPKRIANSDWVMPSGLTNSSSNISPGRVGGRREGNRRATRACERVGESAFTDLLVIIRDFNLVDISSLPSETDPILIVDSDTVLSTSVRPQPFEAISWRYSELAKLLIPTLYSAGAGKEICSHSTLASEISDLLERHAVQVLFPRFSVKDSCGRIVP